MNASNRELISGSLSELLCFIYNMPIHAFTPKKLLVPLFVFYRITNTMSLLTYYILYIWSLCIHFTIIRNIRELIIVS